MTDFYIWNQDRNDRGPLRLKLGHRAAGENPPPHGTIVYICQLSDYGCAVDDTDVTGIEHISVTLDEKGGYPFFTVPVEDLEPLNPVPTAEKVQ